MKRLVLTIFILFSVFGVKAQNALDTAKKLELEASSLYKSGQYKQAVKLFSQSRKVYTDNNMWDLAVGIAQQEALTMLSLGKAKEAKDMLLSEIKNAGNKIEPYSSNRGLFHYALAYCHLYLWELDSALIDIETSIDILSRNEKDKSLLANSYSIGGAIAMRLGNSLKAIRFLKESIRLSEELGAKNRQSLSNSYVNLGSQYNLLGDANSAIEYVEKGINIKETNLGKPNQNLSVMYLSLSSIYSAIGQNKKALDCSKKAIRIKELYPNDSPRNPIDFFKVNLSSHYLSFGDYELATQQCESILGSGIVNQYNYDAIRIIGRVHLLKKEYQKAIFYLKKAQREAKKFNSEDGVYINNIYGTISLAYLGLEEYDSALQNMEVAIDFYRRTSPSYFLMSETYTFKGDIYVAMGEYGKALGMYDSATLAIVKNGKLEISKDNVVYPFSMLKAFTHKLSAFNKAIIPEKKKLLQQHIKKINSLISIIRTDFLDTEDRQLIERDFFKQVYEQQLITYQGALINDANTGDRFRVFQQSNNYNLLTHLSVQDWQYNSNELTTILNERQNVINELNYFDIIEKQEENKTVKSSLGDSIFYKTQTIDSIDNQIKTQYPNYHKLKYFTETISLVQTQSELNSNQALIEYFVGDSNVYAFTITKDLAEIEKLEIKPNELSTLIKNFRKGLNKPDADSKLYFENGHQLYQSVLAQSITKLPSLLNI
jgi:tetratricopeptide (TPR) repeat protein